MQGSQQTDIGWNNGHGYITITLLNSISCTEDQSVTPNTPNCTYQHSGTVWNASASVACTSGQVRSEFNSSSHGWTMRLPSDADASITYNSTGGNPGGYLVFNEPGQGTPDFFQAPSLFLGNRSGFYGGSLSFDFKISSLVNLGTPAQGMLLEGNGVSLYATVAPPSLAFETRTTPFTVGNWYLTSSNAVATEAQIRSVLSNITALYIRADHRSGSELLSLDNVIMFPGPLSYTLSGATTGTGTSLDGASFNAGTTTVTWSIMNNCANPYTCSYTVTVTPPNTYYQDSDLDGYGIPGITSLGCAPTPGWVTNILDCDDSDANLTIPGNTCNDGNAATVNDVVTATCTCEGIPIVEVNVKAWLEGASNGAANMRDDLRSATPSLLPLSHPYTGTPFSLAPTTPIDAAVMAVNDVNNAIVDWIVIELRNPSDPTIILHKRAALLQRDGDVVDADGISALRFLNVPPGNYYVAIRHRNHLGVMTAAPIALSSTAAVIDLSDPATPTWGTNARKIIGGMAMLWAGNTNSDIRLRYSGSGNDRDPIIQQIYQTIALPTPTSVVLNVYSNNDVNLDGVVKYANQANDRDPILQNVGGVVSTATHLEQLP